MPRYRSDYALEKLNSFLESMASGPLDVRKRISNSFSIIQRLTINDFSELHKQEWTEISNDLRKKGPLENNSGMIVYGSVENTMLNIRNVTGSKIVERIINLRNDLEREDGLNSLE